MSEITTSVYCWWDLYSGRNEHNKNIPIDTVINDLKCSGFSTVIAWSVHVNATSGDLIFNDPPSIVHDGSYVGDSGWPASLAALKQGKTSVNRLLFSVGSGGGPTDFANIKTLIKSQGTGPDSILYKNFKALKDAIPAIDGIDFDDEDLYDQPTILDFALMLRTIGYREVTFCPYICSDFWVGCLSAIDSQAPGLVTGFNLQCYSGGAGNDPQDWINAIQNKMGSGFDAKGFVYPGLCASNNDGDAGGGLSPDEITTQFTKWRSAGIQGGWIWRYDHIKNFGKYTAADYASAIVKGLQVTTPVYLYTAQNPSRYYYTTNPADSPGPDWSPSGVAFIACESGTPSVTPVRQHSAGNPQRYSYSITGTLAPGWTDDSKTSFYAFKTQAPNTVPVYQYHTLLPDEFWNLLYSLDANVSGWTNDGVAFYVYGASPANDRLYGSANQYLAANAALVSSQNKYKLLYQDDGNLVIYRLSDGKAIWASNTGGNPAWRTYMQPDGNFVIYKSDGNPIWASNTPNHSDSVIIMQDDGNLVIYDSSGKHIWASNTAE